MEPEQLQALLDSLDAVQALQAQTVYALFILTGCVVSAALVHFLFRLFHDN